MKILPITTNLLSAFREFVALSHQPELRYMHDPEPAYARSKVTVGLPLKLSPGFGHVVAQHLDLAVKIHHFRHRESGTAQQRIGEATRLGLKLGALGRQADLNETLIRRAALACHKPRAFEPFDGR